MRHEQQQLAVREIASRDFERIIDQYLMQGFQIDMVMPSDAPREVLLSKDRQQLKLRSKNSQRSSSVDWATGRAGMMYRDLLPDRLGGRLIASHIRLTDGGPVPDYVHYHKIDFQLIYCLKGRIRVVYEEQGEPFWLEPGDCVLQPPEIRHRVLECEAGSEVLEISSPAEHETWIEHEITLPTQTINSERLFGGQRFVRSVGRDAVWIESNGVAERDLGICEATNGLIDVRIRRAGSRALMAEFSPRPGMIGLGFVVGGLDKEVAIDSHTNSSTASVSAEVLRIEFRDNPTE